jgi:hypothetical protein
MRAKIAPQPMNRPVTSCDQRPRAVRPVARRGDIAMFRRLSVGSVQDITKAAAIVVAVTLIGAGAACADTWKIKLKSSTAGVKVDVYDVVAGKYVARNKSLSGSITVDAQAKKGGGSELDKPGTHIRWSATLNGKCWWGQVCSTKSPVSASLGALNASDSVAAGNCRIEGSTPACGSSH